MKEKVLNAMVIAAMAKLCEERCGNVDICNTRCPEQDYLFEMIFKYPVLELDLDEEEEKTSKPEILYRCPVCHDVLTEEAHEEQLEMGGQGYCYCQFKDGERILTGYDVYHLSTSTAKKVQE